MARPLRIELAGGLYHVTSRGDRREDIYLGDADREAWLAVFAQVCARFNWRCHAWCQMANNYHIVIETAEANLAQRLTALIAQDHERLTRFVNMSSSQDGGSQAALDVLGTSLGALTQEAIGAYFAAPDPGQWHQDVEKGWF